MNHARTESDMLSGIAELEPIKPAPVNIAAVEDASVYRDDNHFATSFKQLCAMRKYKFAQFVDALLFSLFQKSFLETDSYAMLCLYLILKIVTKEVNQGTLEKKFMRIVVFWLRLVLISRPCLAVQWWKVKGKASILRYPARFLPVNSYRFSLYSHFVASLIVWYSHFDHSQTL